MTPYRMKRSLYWWSWGFLAGLAAGVVGTIILISSGIYEQLQERDESLYERLPRIVYYDKYFRLAEEAFDQKEYELASRLYSHYLKAVKQLELSKNDFTPALAENRMWAARLIRLSY